VEALVVWRLLKDPVGWVNLELQEVLILVVLQQVLGFRWVGVCFR